MIIVSQDKMQIVNFENINNITVEGLRIFSYSNNYNGKDETKAFLGEYKTIERAKKVLIEIGSAYTTMSLVNTRMFQPEETVYGRDLIPCIAYEMPKE